jgi:hypothetical protein
VDHIDDALERAGQERLRQPIPPTTYGQVKHLLDQAAVADRRAIRGTGQPPATGAELARRVAGLLGVAPRTVERWRDKRTRHARPETGRVLADTVRRTWQPRIRAQARAKAASSGLTVETRARFGYDAPGGTTDDARVRRLTVRLPPEHARRLIEAQDLGAGEHQLRQILAAAFQDVYFQDDGRRARGLNVEFTDIVYMDVSFPR